MGAGIIRRPFAFLADRALENVLQRELHDSRVFRRGHLAEVAAVQVHDGIVYVEAVRNVESVRPEFKLLLFTKLECPGDGYIELP